MNELVHLNEKLDHLSRIYFPSENYRFL